ncbi:putative membrane protein [Escherichia coli 2845650]|nr:putative membrane protein [Escherichia coli 2845650]
MWIMYHRYYQNYYVLGMVIYRHTSFVFIIAMMLFTFV